MRRGKLHVDDLFLWINGSERSQTAACRCLFSRSGIGRSVLAVLRFRWSCHADIKMASMT
jgi:hypothetical protein